MGDRSNIIIKRNNQPDMYFYSHWLGAELAVVLNRALARGKDRWDDPSYLARIIFCEMVEPDIMGETGFGLSTALEDNEYPFIEVYVDKNIVTIGNNTWSFEDYVREADLALMKIMENGV
jgi:hypothetical protein